MSLPLIDVLEFVISRMKVGKGFAHIVTVAVAMTVVVDVVVEAATVVVVWVTPMQEHALE